MLPVGGSGSLPLLVGGKLPTYSILNTVAAFTMMEQKTPEFKLQSTQLSVEALNRWQTSRTCHLTANTTILPARVLQDYSLKTDTNSAWKLKCKIKK